MKPVRSTARALLGAIFVVSGGRALANPDRHVTDAKRVTDRITPLLEKTDSRLPTDARTLVKINGAAQLAGGLLLTTGHLARPAAALLAGSLVPTTLAGHPFWETDDPVQRLHHQTQFMKNLGLLGGLLLAAVDTGGEPSLRWRAGRAAKDTRRSVGRALHTARREARIARRAATTARKLPG